MKGMKRFVSLLMVVVILILALVAPASAAQKSDAAQTDPWFPLKRIEVKVRMLACTNLAAKTGCYPLVNAYWQFKPEGNPWWVDGGTLMGGTNAQGYGYAEFFPDYRWNGKVYCKGYNLPNGAENITSVTVTGQNSKTVTCPTLYSQG